MKAQRLFWQFFPISLLITMGAILAVTWFSTSTLRTFYLEQMRSDITARALLLEPKINDLATSSPQKLQKFCRQTGRRASTRITVVQNDGKVLADSNENPARMENHKTRPELVSAFAGNTGSALRFSRTLGQEMLYVAIPVVLGSGKHGALRLSVPATSLNAVINSMRRKILLASLLIILLSAVISSYMTRRISRPLEEIKQGAELLAHGKVDRFITIPDHGMSTEMIALTRSLNQMARQINERIQTIKNQSNELEAVFTSMREAVVAVDGEECVIRMNRAASQLLHIDGKRVKGLPVQGLLRDPQIMAMIRTTIRENDNCSADIKTFNGQRHSMLQVRVVPLQDNTLNPIGALAVLNDVTRINQLESLRSDFVANVSHELKTPITAIQGYVETLLDGAMKDRDNAQKFLEIIARQTNRLDAIINDLLILSRIENNEKKECSNRTLQNVAPALISTQQTCSYASDKKNITVKVDYNKNLQANINQPLLEQALVNLLTNAITYSEPGSTILLKASAATDDKGDKTVVISVTDYGSGIGKEHHDRIFERFYRCDKSRSRANGGTGLGLAIVKHIAQGHGGTIQVTSSPGKGATFTLTLEGGLEA